MPIYEYRCVACAREIEVIHGINAEGPTTCDVCGAPMRKLMSAPAIVFRGGGWAKKDARESRSARSADGASAGAEKSAAEGEKAAAEGEKAAAGAEKAPGEGTSRRDKPAEAAASGGGEKGAPGGGKSSRSSGSDD